MAGVLQIHEMTSSVAGTDKTSGTVRFKAADNVTVDSANRLQIGGTTSFSYTKHLKGYVSSAPEVDFSNLEAYTDGGTFANSVTCMYIHTQSWSANVTTNIAGADLFTKVTGDRIDMNSWDTTHTAGQSPAYWGDVLKLQLAVGATAAPGTLTPAEVLTFSYDET